MEFRELKIERARYGENKGNLEGVLRVGGDGVDMNINISEARAKKIIDLCADVLIEQATETANMVREDVIEHHKPNSALINAN